MWKSNGSSPFAALSACAVTSEPMKLEKFWARSCCFGSIEFESSTTNRMSAVVTSPSFTCFCPGWKRHEPTGLKL